MFCRLAPLIVDYGSESENPVAEAVLTPRSRSLEMKFDSDYDVEDAAI